MLILKRLYRGYEVVLPLHTSSHILLFLTVADLTPLARNLTRAILKFDHEMHGVNKYTCEARNKHGSTKIFITVIIPGVCVCACEEKKI